MSRIICVNNFSSINETGQLFFRYFTDGLQTIEHFGTYIEDLMNRLSHIRTEQDEERRDLTDIRNTLKNSPGFNKVVSQLKNSTNVEVYIVKNK